MELIVNENHFSADLKRALGFPDADISYDRLLPTVEIATDEIRDIITEENYLQLLAYAAAEEPDFAETETYSANAGENTVFALGTEDGTPILFTQNTIITLPGEPEPVLFASFSDLLDLQKAEFLKLVKYALLSKAFNMYVGLGDLTVSNNGRTMRRDEHNVSAFNWQIEKHDQELEQLHYRHLDRMLRFMMKHNLKVNQEKYNHRDLLVNSLAIFETFMDVKGSYALYLRLIPGLREAEKQVILPRIGEILYEQVKSDRTSDLAYMVHKIIVYHALVWGFYKLELQIFPKGMLSHNSVYSVVNSRNNTETRLMRQALALNFERDLDRDKLKLEEMVREINRPVTEITTDEIELPEFGFDFNDGFVNT